MTASWQHVLRRLARRIWFRAMLFSIAAVALAVLSKFLTPVLPQQFDANLGQDSVGGLLQILASSMLAVTTFSLTVMVAAYSAASTIATPRATQLLMQDPTSQNALSVFLGAFLFSIVGIIALSVGYYGDRGRVLLFAGTLVVVGVIVVTLLRWISHITTFGRMSDVIDRVERAAVAAARAAGAAPYLGGQPARAIPEGAVPFYSERTGYVTHVDVQRLQREAEAGGFDVHIAALPGALVHPQSALAFVGAGPVDDAVSNRLSSAFAVERHRNFDQDPRLGLITLSEIGSRALSPAVNDPGTAIEVINALHRVFRSLREALRGPAADADVLERVFVPGVAMQDMVQDAFRPLARDGAGMVEVVVRLRKTLLALAADAGPDAAVFEDMAAESQDRAVAALDFDLDRQAVRGEPAHLTGRR